MARECKNPECNNKFVPDNNEIYFSMGCWADGEQRVWKINLLNSLENKNF